MKQDSNSLAALTGAELEAVSGGWCGTPWPGQFGGIIVLPDPEPEPWYLKASRFDMVALNPQPLPPKTIFSF
jgi:hypothetical protein